MDSFAIDKIQFFSIIFSGLILLFIFNLVKNKRIREEYSILWFAMGFFFLYLSLDRQAIDRLGHFFGIAYPPSVLTLMSTGFTFLLLIHLTVVITRLSDQNKEMIQEMGLWCSEQREKGGDILAIVPAYNEGQNIAGVIAALRALPIALDILVVNDGSSDDTSQKVKETGGGKMIDLPKNLGIGGAVQTGFKYAARNGYRVAFQFDGDGQHMADQVPGLLEALEKHGVNMVIGSRFLDSQAGFRSTFLRRVGIRLFQGVNSLLIGQRITDNTSGFRAYDRRAIEFLAQNYPVDYPEPEAVILLGRNGFTMMEVKAMMNRRQDGKSSISGLYGAYYMVKVLLAILMTALRKPVSPANGNSQLRK